SSSTRDGGTGHRQGSAVAGGQSADALGVEEGPRTIVQQGSVIDFIGNFKSDIAILVGLSSEAVAVVILNGEGSDLSLLIFAGSVYVQGVEFLGLRMIVVVLRTHHHGNGLPGVDCLSTSVGVGLGSA